MVQEYAQAYRSGFYHRFSGNSLGSTCGGNIIIPSSFEWNGDQSGASELYKFERTGGKIGGTTLTITGLKNFYYIPGVTDMRCGYFRLLEIVKNKFHRDPYNGDVFIFISNHTPI